MIQQKLTDLLQAQLTMERTNSQFYQALAAAADLADRHGAKSFFLCSAKDERGHARQFQDYLIDRDVKPLYEAIPVIPDIDGGNYVGMFQLALQREQKTTAAINELVAASADDPQTLAFLMPYFPAEQTEEEEQLSDYIDRLLKLDADGVELFDHRLKKKYK